MNPIQHGEVYVTDDGIETDLDLGHYERFIDENLDKIPTLQPVKYTGLYYKKNATEIMAVVLFRLSLILPMRLKAVFTGMTKTMRCISQSLKSVERSATLKVSRFGIHSSVSA